MVLVTTFSLNGQNRWNISAGANVSHMMGRYFGHYGWGAGGFLAGGYEINFNEHWSLMPKLELSYVNNGAILKSPYSEPYKLDWRESLSAVVPVTAAFRFRIAGTTGMRISAGPYLQDALLVRKYDKSGDRKETMGLHAYLINRFNFGMLGEVAVETGDHFAYTLSARYPLLKKTWSRKTLTMSLGFRYYF